MSDSNKWDRVITSLDPYERNLPSVKALVKLGGQTMMKHGDGFNLAKVGETLDRMVQLLPGIADQIRIHGERFNSGDGLVALIVRHTLEIYRTTVCRAPSKLMASALTLELAAMCERLAEKIKGEIS